MRFVIFGAGAIGRVVGARLHQSGQVARLLLAALLLAACLSGCGGSGLPRPDVFAQVGTAQSGVRPVPPGFIGVSMEFQTAALVAGPASDPNVVVQHLIAGLAPGQDPVVRIGGDSTDHAWWPAPGVRDPDLSAFRLTPAWLASIRTLARATHARVVPGINLEADNPRLAAVEARALVNGIGPSSVQALEIGNEANLYSTLYWYKTPAGVKIYGRPAPYTPSQYLGQFAQVAQVVPASVPLAGPALGAPVFMAQTLPPLLSAEPRLTLVTYHRYPLNRCFTSPKMPTYPTIPNLMKRTSSVGLAESVGGYVRAARARGDVFRVDELNSVACSGKVGVSNTFASALWVLDTLFAMAQQGVSGVNIHTLPSAAYRLFTVHRSAGRWSATVAPEYYGLIMFTRAAPPGSRLLDVSSRGSGQVRTWATGGRGLATRVLLINDSPHRSHTVRVRLPGGRSVSGATLQRLGAPSLAATAGISLGGRSFGAPTRTGVLGSPRHVGVPHSRTAYFVTLPPASAALLTVPSS